MMHFQFQYEGISDPFFFCFNDVLADYLAKGVYLTLATPTLPICTVKNCSVDDSLYLARSSKSYFITAS